MAKTDDQFSMMPLVAALSGWLVPGSGYFLIGQRTRGIVVGVGVIVLYLSGLLIAGVRVIEVPGYETKTGEAIHFLNGRQLFSGDRDYDRAPWIITGGGAAAEITNKPWFAGQILAGPLCLASASFSMRLARGGEAEFPRTHAPLDSIGTLFTAIAGMLNLLAIMDAAHRAGNPPVKTGSGASP
jgi:hypothetical protein